MDPDILCILPMLGNRNGLYDPSSHNTSMLLRSYEVAMSYYNRNFYCFAGTCIFKLVGNKTARDISYVILLIVR